MALKQDERALLQLICERGQSYADLAELLAISEEEVREKARRALTELGGADPDAEVGLTDYLLGQADPIGRADAVRYLQQDAAARELAETVITKLRVISPGADLPSLPDAKGRRRKAAAPSRSEASAAAVAAAGTPAVDSSGADEPTSTAASLSTPQSRLIAGVAAGGVVLLFAILAIVGVFSGDDPSSAAGNDPAAAAETTTSRVDLSPENGSGVAGSAVFGITSSELFIDLELDGLDPDLSRKSAYVLWLMFDNSGGYPVSVIQPNQNGGVRTRLSVPGAIRDTVVGLAKSVRVSESSVKRLSDDSVQAAQTGVPLVPFSGEGLALGRLPLVAPQGDGSGGSNGGGESGSGGGGGGAGGQTTTPGG